MIALLKRLDASTEKDLQQIHPGHSVTDKLDDPFDQLLDLRLLFWNYLQGAGFSTRAKEKGGSPVDCPGVG